MARTATKKTKTKVKTQAPRIRKNMLQDPQWDGAEKWSGEKFSKNKHAAQSYYNQNYKTVDLIDYVYEWMGKQDEYSRTDIRAAKAAKRNSIQPNLGITARMLTMGMPVEHKAYSDWWVSLAGTSDNPPRPFDAFLREKIALAVAEGEEILKTIKQEEAVKNKAYVPSIQERMRETCSDMTEEIEEFIDGLIKKFDSKAVKDFDPLSLLRKAQAKPGHVRILRKWYEGEYQEFYELNNLPSAAKIKKLTDEEQDMIAQLKEGYSHLDKKQAKEWLTVYEKLLNACDIVEKEAKTQRAPRKVKAKSPEDLVKKMKFKSSDVELGIASVPPAKLIGANIALVFNTKNRKLGIYYASNVDPKGLQRAGSGFSVKGTTLVGYDEERSVQKTVRKPADILKQVKKTTRTKTEKIFGGLTTTETKLNGRFNDETVLLAVF
jgi:hypothetical protein